MPLSAEPVAASLGGEWTLSASKVRLVRRAFASTPTGHNMRAAIRMPIKAPLNVATRTNSRTVAITSKVKQHQSVVV
jgi:hypothetical protein